MKCENWSQSKGLKARNLRICTDHGKLFSMKSDQCVVGAADGYISPYPDWETQRSPGVDDPNDDNNCVPRAFANALNIPYAWIQAYLSKAGRKIGKGTRVMYYLPLLSQLKLTRVRTCRYKPHLNRHAYGISLGRFIREHPTGTWLVSRADHLLCIKDGVFIDRTTNLLTQRVESYIHVPDANYCQLLGIGG